MADGLKPGMDQPHKGGGEHELQCCHCQCRCWCMVLLFMQCSIYHSMSNLIECNSCDVIEYHVPFFLALILSSTRIPICQCPQCPDCQQINHNNIRSLSPSPLSPYVWTPVRIPSDSHLDILCQAYLPPLISLSCSSSSSLPHMHT